MSADSKYFQSTKRGEIAELRDELNSKEKDQRKDAVKKVIAAMTVGKDVSLLFADVLKCMVTPDLELRKLVYLYLMNYAKTQPELAILAVNAFVKDSRDPNPLIRALAIRTMSSIRVEEITNYLCEPLRKCIKDEDPYVRKTAAICVAKLHDVDPVLVDDQGFLDDLRELLGDPNPMVVANAVAALTEIVATNPSAFELNEPTVQKLLAALNECTEWGQIFILDSMAGYTPQDSKEAESIIERVLARLSHANSGVVLSACKVIIRMVDYIEDQDYIVSACKKMAPALVTLLNAEPEVQYVALRNMIIVLQKLPALLADKDIRVFICKYNDPIYVKMEKIEIMIQLANPSNVVQVLQEFKDCAQEVDVDFVRRAVRAIGRTAIKLEEAADRCINVLLELIQTKVSYVVQEAIVVIKDIFRKYPNRYESVIGALCENLDTLDEPEAKASLFWILGEYADRIDNVAEILESFCDTFAEEPADVQLQLLTAVVKLLIVTPDDPAAQELMKRVLQMATASDNPDLRDRAIVYWRMILSAPATARDVVMSEKPVISSESPVVDPAILGTLLREMATLASVYHKVPEAFVSKLKASVIKTGGMVADTEGDLMNAVSRVRRTEDDDGGVTRESSNTLVDDILGGQLSSAPTTATSTTSGGTGLEDLMGGMSMGGAGDLLSQPVAAAPMPAAVSPVASAGAPAVSAAAQQQLLLDSGKGEGIEVRGAFVKSGGQPALSLTIANKRPTVVQGLLIQFNANSFGLMPKSTKIDLASVLPHGSGAAIVPLHFTSQVAAGAPSRVVQIALKADKVFIFEAKLNLDVVADDTRLDRSAFLTAWKGIPDTVEQGYTVRNISDRSPDAVQRKLEGRNVFFVARRNVDNSDVSYYSMKLHGDVIMLVEVTLTPGHSDAKICVKSQHSTFAPLVFEFLEDVLTH